MEASCFPCSLGLLAFPRPKRNDAVELVAATEPPDLASPLDLPAWVVIPGGMALHVPRCATSGWNVYIVTRD